MRVERTTYDQLDRPLEYAVGFFRGDRTSFVVEVRGDLVGRRAQARRRAPCGSYSGSAATSAPTQSPKMSTSSRVPTAVASGGT